MTARMWQQIWNIIYASQIYKQKFDKIAAAVQNKITKVLNDPCMMLFVNEDKFLRTSGYVKSSGTKPRAERPAA